jgi:DNA-binding response OmpR family regulator
MMKRIFWSFKLNSWKYARLIPLRALKRQKLPDENFYHIAVLDIMGVRGCELLEIANKKDIPALMLTAHAISKAEDIISLKGTVW